MLLSDKLKPELPLVTVASGREYAMIHGMSVLMLSTSMKHDVQRTPLHGPTTCSAC